LDFLSKTWVKIDDYWVFKTNSDKLKAGMYYSEYPTNAYMQASIIIDYKRANPFDDEYVDYCLKTLEKVICNMPIEDQDRFRSLVTTYDEDYKWCTGTEAKIDGISEREFYGVIDKLQPVMQKQVRRGGKFNSTSSFKVGTTSASNKMSSSEPINISVMEQHSKSEINKGKQILNSDMIGEEAKCFFDQVARPFPRRQYVCVWLS